MEVLYIAVAAANLAGTGRVLQDTSSVIIAVACDDIAEETGIDLTGLSCLDVVTTITAPLFTGVKTDEAAINEEQI